MLPWKCNNDSNNEHNQHELLLDIYQNLPITPPTPLPGAPLPLPERLSCSMMRELVKNGRSDGFGVDPIDMLSMSGPESSPSQQDNDSSSWKRASKSRSPRNAAVPLCASSSSSPLALKRFNSATIFCLKLRCCSEIVWKKEETS